MPFSTTTTPPATNAKVTVMFGGLMLLKPDQANGCEIGIHRYSSGHMFQAILIVNKLNQSPKLIRLLTGPLTKPFAIKVTSGSGTGVKVFTPTAEPFDRHAATNDDRDFRWALNLSEMHKGVDFKDGANPPVTLNAGVLFTPTLTPKTLGVDWVNGGKKTKLNRISVALAAAIDLSAGGKVELSWDQAGDPQSFTLPRLKDQTDLANTTYTLFLSNDPPSRNTVIHDELDLYYKVLELKGAPILSKARGRLSFTSPPSTDDIPCMPVVLNS